MSLPKHTPGPWRVVVHEDEAFILHRGDDMPQGIVSIPLRGNGARYCVNLANAHLIAAAPDHYIANVGSERCLLMAAGIAEQAGNFAAARALHDQAAICRAAIANSTVT